MSSNLALSADGFSTCRASVCAEIRLLAPTILKNTAGEHARPVSLHPHFCSRNDTRSSSKSTSCARCRHACANSDVLFSANMRIGFRTVSRLFTCVACLRVNATYIFSVFALLCAALYVSALRSLPRNPMFTHSHGSPNSTCPDTAAFRTSVKKSARSALVAFVCGSVDSLVNPSGCAGGCGTRKFWNTRPARALTYPCSCVGYHMPEQTCACSARSRSTSAADTRGTAKITTGMPPKLALSTRAWNACCRRPSGESARLTSRRPNRLLRSSSTLSSSLRFEWSFISPKHSGTSASIVGVGSRSRAFTQQKKSKARVSVAVASSAHSRRWIELVSLCCTYCSSCSTSRTCACRNACDQSENARNASLSCRHSADVTKIAGTSGFRSWHSAASWNIFSCRYMPPLPLPWSMSCASPSKQMHTFCSPPPSPSLTFSRLMLSGRCEPWMWMERPPRLASTFRIGKYCARCLCAQPGSSS